MLESEAVASVISLTETGEVLKDLLELLCKAEGDLKISDFSGKEMAHLAALHTTLDKYDVRRSRLLFSDIWQEATHRSPVDFFVHSCKMENEKWALAALALFSDHTPSQRGYFNPVPWNPSWPTGGISSFHFAMFVEAVMVNIRLPCEHNRSNRSGMISHTCDELRDHGEQVHVNLSKVVVDWAGVLSSLRSYVTSTRL